jgi:glucosamine-6-phosphate isomerase
MTINIYNTYDEMSAAVAEFIAANVAEKPNGLFCFPSGDTPTGTLKNLVEMRNEGRVDFTEAHFVGLDEWVGMDKSDQGSCQQYVYEHFFFPAGISQDQIQFFDARAADLLKECQKIDAFISSRNSINLTMLGVGVNGHLGLNEPGTSFESPCHVSELATTTKQGAQKYFISETMLKRGITLGHKHIMNSEVVIMIANGKKKAEIIQKIIEGAITEQVPASILQRHPNCYVFLDKDAASLLKTI